MTVTEQLQLVRKKVEEGVFNVGGPVLHKTPHAAGGDEHRTQEALTLEASGQGASQ